ncbi:MAG: hypothetical protein LUQ38_00610 [Methanotrichaceae archaeon]|nr:hypothetical protein [Methanotrichaceae archaeon]
MSYTHERVNWGKLKKGLGQRYSEPQSPLPALEHNKKLNKQCEIITYTGGDEIISPQEQQDGIYILLDGIVAVGDKRVYGTKDRRVYYVQNLTLRPFSFIGEIEAPMEIESIQFPKLEPQQHSWVTSEILSRVMAYSDDPIPVTVPSGSRTHTFASLVSFLKKGLLEIDDFELRSTEGGEVSTEDRRSFIRESKEAFVELFSEQGIKLPSEKTIFSRNAKATLLKVPLHENFADELWSDKAIRRFVCEDAFIKNKKYWLMPQEGNLQRTIIALYHHAELNNILIDGNLYILGNDRIRAITNKTEIYRDSDQHTIKNYLTRRGFLWETNNDTKKKDKSFIESPDICDVYNFMTLGAGGNKEIFKVGRVSNT